MDKLKIGHHIINLNYFVLGYKIDNKNYYGINYLITLMIYSIHKAYHLSDQKGKNVNIFSLFKMEFFKRYEIDLVRKCRIDNTISKLEKILRNNL